MSNTNYAEMKKTIENLVKGDKSLYKECDNLFAILNKKIAVDEAVRVSFTAPKEIPYDVAVEDERFPKHLVCARGRRPHSIFVDKGEFYSLKTLCVKYNLNYVMVWQRLNVLGWEVFRALGVENHRNDHYIVENLEMMRDK